MAKSTYRNPDKGLNKAKSANPFAGDADAADQLAEQARSDNQKAPLTDKNALHGARTLQSNSTPLGLGDELNHGLDSAQRQQSFDPLRPESKDPKDFPQFSSLLKASSTSPGAPYAKRPTKIDESPSKAPLKGMPDFQAMLSHPEMKKWLSTYTT